MSAPEDEEKPTFDSVKSGRDTEAKFKYVSYSCGCLCVFVCVHHSCGLRIFTIFATVFPVYSLLRI